MESNSHISIEAKQCSVELDSDSGAEFETDGEARQDAYRNMYAQWLRVVDENCALVSENAFLIDLKDKSEKKV